MNDTYQSIYDGKQKAIEKKLSLQGINGADVHIDIAQANNGSAEILWVTVNLNGATLDESKVLRVKSLVAESLNISKDLVIVVE